MRNDAALIEVYGQTENIGPTFRPNPKGPLGNCGQLTDTVKVKVFTNYKIVAFGIVITC